jgi:hypothetical protein
MPTIDRHGNYYTESVTVCDGGGVVLSRDFNEAFNKILDTNNSVEWAKAKFKRLEKRSGISRARQFAAGFNEAHLECCGRSVNIEEPQ